MSEIKWIAMLTPCPDAALPRGFHTTRWSVIRQAIADDDKQSREALEQICRAYWYPLYAFVRRSGHSREDSQDLVQGFFLKLLNKHLLGVANPDKGKLRTFLLTCLRRYLLDERDRAMAQKREGNRGVSSSLALDTDWLSNATRRSLWTTSPRTGCFKGAGSHRPGTYPAIAG